MVVVAAVISDMVVLLVVQEVMVAVADMVLVGVVAQVVLEQQQGFQLLLAQLTQ